MNAVPMEDNVSVKSEPLGSEVEAEYLEEEYLELQDDDPDISFVIKEEPRDYYKPEPDAEYLAKRTCEVCGKVFTKISPLIEHLKRHLNPRTAGARFCYRCCAEFDYADYQKHLIVTHHSHVCNFPDCTKSYANRSSLHRHIQDKHTDKQKLEATFQCDICKKYYVSKQSIQVHMTYVHLPQTGRFKCNDCNKIYSSVRYLSKHRYKVHRSRNYQCDECQSIYKSKDRLIQHIYVVHTSIKKLSHQCEKCLRKFSCSIYLQRHIKMIHLTPRECKHCHKVLRSVFRLNKHLVRRHDAEIFECDICGKVLKKKYSMKMHLKKFHPKLK